MIYIKSFYRYCIAKRKGLRLLCLTGRKYVIKKPLCFGPHLLICPLCWNESSLHCFLKMSWCGWKHVGWILGTYFRSHIALQWSKGTCFITVWWWNAWYRVGSRDRFNIWPQLQLKSPLGAFEQLWMRGFLEKLDTHPSPASTPHLLYSRSHPPLPSLAVASEGGCLGNSSALDICTYLAT